MQEKTLFELCESNDIPLHIECDIESRSRGINVLSLFDGMSCGQLALTSPGTEFPVTSWLQGALTGQFHSGITSVNKYFACEIKPHAMQVTQENFPETVQLGDVTKVKANELPRIDLLVGGSPCFVAGTKVYTKYGYVNIEDINVGDEVLTHTLTYKKVLRVGGDHKSIVEIVPNDGRDIKTETTSNHPYYTRHMTPDGWSKPTWIEVGKLDPNYDFIAFPSELIDGQDNVNYHGTNVSEESNITWVSIKSITKTNTTNHVYNIEVEGDNSYTANSVIVHNCQDFSQANRERKGVEGSKSGLFWEWVRLVKETRPKYFLLENVKMKKEHEKVVTDVLGVEPIKINSKLVSGQLRNRLYWTNIPDIKIPEEIDIKLQDVLTDGYTDREKSRCLLESDSRPLATPVKMFHRYYSTGFTTLVFKSEQHYLDCKEHYDTHHKGKAAKDILESDPVYEGLRYLNQTELERLQTVPEGYTKSLSRNNAACLLGDGWTVDVIRHILSYMKIECVESALSHVITQQRHEVESEQLHASLDEFMKDLK